VDEAGRVQKQERFESLVHDVLLVRLLENVGADHRVQVRLHVLKYEVDVLVVVRLEHIV